jgi:lysyl-tRNA synthetase class 1
MKTKLEEYEYLKETRHGLDDRIKMALEWVQDIVEEEHEPITLSDTDRIAIQSIVTELENATNIDEYQATIFNAAKTHNLKPRDIFPIVYQILLGQPRGPRFGPYVGLVGKESVIKTLREALQ